MGKRHPLDIFRTSDGGFESASRKRRTVTGKVVASSPRPGVAVAPARVAPAIFAARGGSSDRSSAGGGSATRPPLNRVLLYSVLLIVGSVLIYVLGAHASASPSLKSETIFTAGDALAAANGYAILAATFHGGDTDYAAAWAARTELEKRGYHAQVLGYRGKDGRSYDRFELLVSHAASSSDLESPLSALRSQKKWPGIDGAPFTAARIVPAPAATP